MQFKEFLKSKGIKQNLLAKELGVSIQLVNKWCNGDCEPQLKHLPAIEKVTGGTIAEIVGCFIYN